MQTAVWRLDRPELGRSRHRAASAWSRIAQSDDRRPNRRPGAGRGGDGSDSSVEGTTCLPNRDSLPSNHCMHAMRAGGMPGWAPRSVGAMRS